MVAQEPARDTAIQETPILDMDSRCPPAADSLHLRFCFIALQHWMISPRVIDRYCGIYWICWTKGRKVILDDFEVPPNTWLVTLDVESLYTCISHELGTQAVAYFLDLNSSGDRRHDSFLLDLLLFILDRNFFTFDRVFYRHPG
ncbi:uncharacterized protein LOC143807586 [Ranitomeya variabilis]|uniref:uncharacterized protein LOC143766508 n=1 Tax=Ranitomeya variabilis TaxID=490064 RepID=UPI004055F978